jgi:hypothetical protein
MNLKFSWILCRIASHYYVNYHTIATFNEHLKPTMGDIELIRLFALADEFKYMIVREVGGWVTTQRSFLVM